MTSSEAYRALSMGPAAWGALAQGVGLRVHSVFASTVNLEVDGAGYLVALCGSRGCAYPHAVALEDPLDFRFWGLCPGARVHLWEDLLLLSGTERLFALDLASAERRPLRLPPPVPPRELLRTCSARLAEHQEHGKFELRWHGPRNPGGAHLFKGADTLGEAVHALVHGPKDAERCLAAVRASVAALVGLGAGLTPAGDDFLCGFLAALRAQGPGDPLEAAFRGAVEANLGFTGDISASMLRLALLGHWPEPLLDLAEALATSLESPALAALEDLCALGHSSGADLATGFLFGLANLPQGAKAFSSVSAVQEGGTGTKLG